MSKAFNVTIIQPTGYIHSMALHEAAEYIRSSLLSLGYKTGLSTNRIEDGVVNIVFCAHLLKKEEASALPHDAIIFNSEQLDNLEGWYFQTGAYASLLQSHHVWDYAGTNLLRIPHDRKSFIPFGFCSDLVRKDIRRRPGASLLFYGSLTPRRESIIERVIAAGVPVNVLMGKYGFERDVKLFKAWAVLNLHNAKDTRAFEQIRCFYPLINRVPVISEQNSDDSSCDHFRNSVFFFEEQELVEGCTRLYKDTVAFANESMVMLDNFARYSAIESLEQAIRFYLDQSERIDRE
ncbi:MAG TPA: hypothetical protein VFW00_08640 [Rhodocyclaceae bacterium]|nr:hypothetical protein [Rhodocyclaceae bacterium]